jgi:hypothetical protein
MIAFPALGVAVLSQIFPEHLQDLGPAHRATLDQAHHHPHILQQERIARRGVAPGNRDAGWWRRRGLGLSVSPAALLVEVAFLLLARGGAIVSQTPDGGLPLTVSFPAAKRTTQVLPTTITRMSEEKDSAMPAPDQAASQVGLGPQNRSQKHVTLQNQSGNSIPSIPLRTEPEMLRDGYCKKPRLSLWMLM